MVLAHKNAPQIARLVGVLRGPGRRFCLHIDVRQTGVSGELHGWFDHDEHVHWAEPPCMCRWGTSSLVDATLRDLAWPAPAGRGADAGAGDAELGP